MMDTYTTDFTRAPAGIEIAYCCTVWRAVRAANARLGDGPDLDGDVVPRRPRSPCAVVSRQKYITMPADFEEREKRAQHVLSVWRI